MFGQGYQVLPGELSDRLGTMEAWLVYSGFTFEGQLVISLSDWIRGTLLIFSGFLICVALPNTGELFGADRRSAGIRWAPGMRWAALTVALFSFGLLNLFQVSQFLYFNF